MSSGSRQSAPFAWRGGARRWRRLLKASRRARTRYCKHMRPHTRCAICAAELGHSHRDARLRLRGGALRPMGGCGSVRRQHRRSCDAHGAHRMRGSGNAARTRRDGVARLGLCGSPACDAELARARPHSAAARRRIRRGHARARAFGVPAGARIGARALAGGGLSSCRLRGARSRLSARAGEGARRAAASREAIHSYRDASATGAERRSSAAPAAREPRASLRAAVHRAVADRNPTPARR